MSDPNPELLMNIKAMKIFFCPQELNDKPLTSVVQDPFHSRPSPVYDALGHINLLELDL